MKALLLLFILFLSCDTPYVCTTVTTMDGVKSYETFMVDKSELDEYDGKFENFAINRAGKLKLGTRVTNCK